MLEPIGHAKLLGECPKQWLDDQHQTVRLLTLPITADLRSCPHTSADTKPHSDQTKDQPRSDGVPAKHKRGEKKSHTSRGHYDAHSNTFTNKERIDRAANKQDSEQTRHSRENVPAMNLCSWIGGPLFGRSIWVFHTFKWPRSATGKPMLFAGIVSERQRSEWAV